MDKFHTRLRQVMFFKGIRQADIVERTGIEKSKISRYVNGHNKPNAAALTKLAEALDVTPSWLIGEGDDLSGADLSRMSADRFLDTEKIQNTAPIIAEVITREELDLVVAFRAADETQKQIVRLTLGVKRKGTK